MEYIYRVYTAKINEPLKHVATITNPDEVIKYIDDSIFHVMVIRHHKLYNMDDVWLNEYATIKENKTLKRRKVIYE